MKSRNQGINGLVLVGGGSRRMGQDKSTILYHNQPHAEYLVKILQRFCSETFISCRSDQKEIWKDHKILVDEHENVGPISALLSAIRENDLVAWIVVGCDYPLVNEDVLSMLVKDRNRNADVSYLCSSLEPRLQPLLAIWEPSAFAQLTEMYNSGKLSLTSCMSVLRSHSIFVLDDDSLMNANTPEEWEKAIKLLKSRGWAKNRRTS